MYGIINQAIKSMIISQNDESLWNEISQALKISAQDFEIMQQYDDSLTGEILEQISERKKISIPVILESFGHYWIQFIQNSEYQGLFVTFLNNPIELIESLDLLHTRLQFIFTKLKAPSFWVTDKSKNSVIIHYKSLRNFPFEFFVIGLIDEIFSLFKQKCRIKMLDVEVGEKGKFQVTWT